MHRHMAFSSVLLLSERKFRQPLELIIHLGMHSLLIGRFHETRPLNKVINIILFSIP